MAKKNSFRIIATIAIIGILVSCETKEDYSGIIYKNYLTYQIESAETFLVTTTEGSEEGQYKTGSKQAYQQVIDEARQVDENSGTTQQQIDHVYLELLKSDTTFYDQMVPFRSKFQIKLDYANYTYGYIQEGSEDGNVPEGNKAALLLVLNEVESQFEKTDLTQRKLNEIDLYLTNTLVLFNQSIIGMASVEVKNNSFEIPGYATDNLKEVPGWSNYGVIENWMSKALVVEDSLATDGSFMAKIGTYTTGIYQNLSELPQPNSEYTMSFDVSLLSNNPDWQNNKFPAVLMSRFIVFNNAPGDYNFITVLSVQYDTLGMAPTGFQTLKHTLELDVVDAIQGKKIAIDFIERHSWDALNPIYAESYVAIDNVKITRD